MRVDNHNHIRHIMLYHFEKGWSAAQSFRDLNELFGQGTITQQGVQKWFARFKSGDTSLEDKLGRGRPWGRGSMQTFFLLGFLNWIHDSSPVTKLLRKGVSSFFRSKSLKIRTRSSLFCWESSWGTHPANFQTFPSFLRWRTMVEWSTSNCSASIRVVRLSSSSTAAGELDRRSQKGVLFLAYPRGLCRRI